MLLKSYKLVGFLMLHVPDWLAMLPRQQEGRTAAFNSSNLHQSTIKVCPMRQDIAPVTMGGLCLDTKPGISIPQRSGSGKADLPRSVLLCGGHLLCLTDQG